MIKLDENALICDLAETYKIYDYKEIAANKVAIFAIGLRDDSRIKMKITNQKIDFKTLLLAKLVDNFNLFLWSRSKDSKTGANKPKSIIGHLYEEDNQISTFKTGKDFEIEKARILAERSK